MPTKPVKITAYESRTYDACGIKQFPVLDYQGVSYCNNCGKCCWDWKGGDLGDKCEHLGEDMATCLIYGRRAEFNRAECDASMQPHQAVDLPEDCGYMVLWKSKVWIT